ncbi:MAG: sulfatase-like hydrolase/transferase [Thermodesulfobacteriota bacterium]
MADQLFRRPNILLLLSDEHGFRFAGHVPRDEGGEPVHTPTLDRLAGQGTRFTDAYCQMPLCTPSRMCMLTGLEARRCGAWWNDSVLRPELQTLPGVLASAGYATCLVGKMHLGGSLQFAGFQHRPYGDLTGDAGHQWEPLGSPEVGHYEMRFRTAQAGVTEIPESLLQERVVSEETVSFIREHAHAQRDKPWFLCASFSRPHFPLTTPARHYRRYWPRGVTRPRVGAGGDAYQHAMSVGMRKGFRVSEISDEEMMHARACYFANVTFLDEILGDMLARLDCDGLLDNTIIVYTSDHGEMVGEHGVWWKQGWYEGCARVPLIVSLPEQRRGTRSARVVRTPVGLIDLFPSLCSLAGADAPKDLDGYDLSQSVKGTAGAPERMVFCDNLMPRWGQGTEFRAIRWRNYKYVHFRSAPPLLFDLAADPGEQRNLASDLPGPSAEALKFLAGAATDTMDFDAAERQRLERDGELKQRYALPGPKARGNLYLMPSGRLVEADGVLQSPTVVSEAPAEFFADWPGPVTGRTRTGENS